MPPAAARVDGAWLAWARVGIAAAVGWQTTQLLYSGEWLTHYVDPPLRVPIWPLGPLVLHGKDALAALFSAMVLLSGLLAVGIAQRPVAALLAGLLVVQFAQDGSLYLNHHYLITLLVLLFAVIPPRAADGTSPAWALQLLRFHVVVPYFFAGIAKLDRDWLSGSPLDIWMPRRVVDPWVGQVATWPTTHLGMAWCSMLLDLGAPLLLLFVPRARVLAWTVLLLFHTLNSRLFHIGVFPWMMLWLTPILLPPDTLRRLREQARRPGPLGVAAVGAVIGGLWPAIFAWMHVVVEAWAMFVLAALVGGVAPERARPPRPPVWLQPWYALHIALPLRHFFIPGDVAWTEEGHRYSWRMLLRDKDVVEAALELTDPATGERRYLRGDQVVEPHQVNDTFSRPDLILAAARLIAEREAAAGRPGLEVRVRARVSLNGRPPTLLVDPDVDMARVDPNAAAPAPWIRPSPRGALSAR